MATTNSNKELPMSGIELDLELVAAVLGGLVSFGVLLKWGWTVVGWVKAFLRNLGKRLSSVWRSFFRAWPAHWRPSNWEWGPGSSSAAGSATAEMELRRDGQVRALLHLAVALCREVREVSPDREEPLANWMLNLQHQVGEKQAKGEADAFDMAFAETMNHARDGVMGHSQMKLPATFLFSYEFGGMRLHPGNEPVAAFTPDSGLAQVLHFDRQTRFVRRRFKGHQPSESQVLAFRVDGVHEDGRPPNKTPVAVFCLEGEALRSAKAAAITHNPSR